MDHSDQFIKVVGFHTPQIRPADAGRADTQTQSIPWDGPHPGRPGIVGDEANHTEVWPGCSTRRRAFPASPKGLEAKSKLSNAGVSGAPEDQLRRPLEGLIANLAEITGLPPGTIVAVGETSLADLRVNVTPDPSQRVDGRDEDRRRRNSHETNI